MKIALYLHIVFSVFKIITETQYFSFRMQVQRIKKQTFSLFNLNEFQQLVPRDFNYFEIKFSSFIVLSIQFGIKGQNFTPI